MLGENIFLTLKKEKKKKKTIFLCCFRQPLKIWKNSQQGIIIIVYDFEVGFLGLLESRKSFLSEQNCKEHE